MTYHIKLLSPKKMEAALKYFLQNLSGIDPDHMTSFELSILHKIAANPPARYAGQELKILD